MGVIGETRVAGRVHPQLWPELLGHKQRGDTIIPRPWLNLARRGESKAPARRRFNLVGPHQNVKCYAETRPGRINTATTVRTGFGP